MLVLISSSSSSSSSTPILYYFPLLLYFLLIFIPVEICALAELLSFNAFQNCLNIDSALILFIQISKDVFQKLHRMILSWPRTHSNM